MVKENNQEKRKTGSRDILNYFYVAPVTARIGRAQIRASFPVEDNEAQGFLDSLQKSGFIGIQQQTIREIDSPRTYGITPLGREFHESNNGLKPIHS
jgi:hypothetical protein